MTYEIKALIYDSLERIILNSVLMFCANLWKNTFLKTLVSTFKATVKHGY